MDGFDHYTEDSLFTLWNQASVFYASRFGISGAERTQFNEGRSLALGSRILAGTFIELDFDQHNITPISSGIIGWRVLLNEEVRTAYYGLRLYDDSDACMQLVWDTTVDQEKIWLNEGTTTGDLICTGLVDENFDQYNNTYMYFEVKFNISDNTPVDTCQIYINGTLVASNTGSSDTNKGSNGSVNKLWLGGHLWGYAYVDDFYIKDFSGDSDPNPMETLHHNVRVKTFNPISDVASEMVGQDNDSTDNYLNVDDSIPDSGATHVSGVNTDHYDLYSFDSMPSNIAAVRAMQTNTFAKKDLDGGKYFYFWQRLGIYSDFSDPIALSTGYQDYFAVWNKVAPDLDWDVVGVDNTWYGLYLD